VLPFLFFLSYFLLFVTNSRTERERELERKGELPRKGRKREEKKKKKKRRKRRGIRP
jgi:hypothetical protein